MLDSLSAEESLVEITRQTHVIDLCKLFELERTPGAAVARASTPKARTLACQASQGATS